MQRVLIVVVAAVALLAGCASTSHGSHPASAGLGEVDGIPIPGPQITTAAPVILAPTSCPSALPAILSRANKGGTPTVHVKRTPHLITCTYTATPTARRGCTKAEVEINTDPQAFRTFQRWTVETGQNAMWSSQPALDPRPVMGIGIEAEWVPATLTFETATMNTWVAVFLTCPVRSAQDRRLGAAMGKVGLAATS